MFRLTNIFCISLIFIAICLFANPVSGELTATIAETGASYITWGWTTNESITNITIDGYQIKYFDNSANTFTLSDCKPLESHTIRLYSATQSTTLTANTTEPIEQASDNFWNFVGMYLTFGLILVCLYASLTIPFMGLVAFTLSLVGIAESLNNSFAMGTIFGIMCVSSIYLSFRDMN